jgi:hypothetical protein
MYDLIYESRSEYMVTRERYFDFIASLSNMTQLFRTLKRPLNTKTVTPSGEI